MNHNEEMKLLGYLKKIADNTGRIADALEKMVPPVPPEVKPVIKDASLGIVKVCCETCRYGYLNEDICANCSYTFSHWEPKKEIK